MGNVTIMPLATLQEHCKNYTSDPTFVYTKRHDEEILVMKIPADAKTNEDRQGIVNKDRAIFRTDKAEVVLTISLVGSGLVLVTYGEINRESHMIEHTNYFKTLEPAYYYIENAIFNDYIHMITGVEYTDYNGAWTVWNTDGRLMAEGSMKNGYRCGVWYFNEWTTPDQPYPKQIACEYKHGNKTGRWTDLDKDGRKCASGYYYVNDYSHYKTGTWTYYDRQGTVASTSGYEYGVKHGNTIYYDPNGRTTHVIEYNDGRELHSWEVK